MKAEKVRVAAKQTYKEMRWHGLNLRQTLLDYADLLEAAGKVRELITQDAGAGHGIDPDGPGG